MSVVDTLKRIGYFSGFSEQERTVFEKGNWAIGESPEDGWFELYTREKDDDVWDCICGVPKEELSDLHAVIEEAVKKLAAAH